MNIAEYNFMRPMWRRIAATVVSLSWAYLEWSTNNPFWAVVALGFTGYCLWNYFYRFEANEPEE